MMNISNKEAIKRKLLVELLQRTEPITVTKLAALLNKTGRTMRSYLDEIQEEYQSQGVDIVRKTNVGVYVRIEDGLRSQLLESLEFAPKAAPPVESFSSKYRQVYILKTLFEDKFAYTLQMFADDLYCSKSTVVNELVHVQKWLETYHLTLQRRQNQGLWIEGDEKDYRRAFKALIDDIKDKEEPEEELAEPEDNLDYRIDIVDYVKIKNMFPKINLYAIQRIIQEAEKELGIYFTDQAFLNLITHMAITIERLRSHKALSRNEHYFENSKKEREYTIAKWVLKELSKEFNVTFPEEEIGYISIHMMGAKVQDPACVEECSQVIESYNADFTDMAKSIISLASDILDVDLTKDDRLLTRLVLHLRPTVMRLKYGLRLTNPILTKIKEEYANIFGVAWACNSIFEKKYGVSINEDEVGYLALHLALAVEHIQGKVKTIIVCSSGIGTSQLVASKLVKRFDNLDITQILPYNLLTEAVMAEADLIVTTIRNIRNSEKVVYISTLVNEKDCVNIANTLQRLKKSWTGFAISQDNQEAKEQGEFDKAALFEQNLCFLDSEFTDFPKAINHYGQLMEQMGYGKAGFYQDILAREKQGSTYIGKGLAIPHAKDSFVNESKVCIVRFKEPVLWQGNQVEVLFMLCLKCDDIQKTKAFFKKLYAILEDKEKIKTIKKAQSMEEITHLFD